MQDTLVFLEYLETGLIPVNGFHSTDIEEFEKMLESLSEEDSKKAKRKFRKIFRKIVKEKFGNQPVSRAFKNAYGIGEKNPTKAQMRNRRHLVHNAIYQTVITRLKDA